MHTAIYRREEGLLTLLSSLFILTSYVTVVLRIVCVVLSKDWCTPQYTQVLKLYL